MIRLAVLFAVGLGFACCTPNPNAPPQPDASDASGIDLASQACQRLASFGCREGTDQACAGRLRAGMTTGHTTPIELACVANAANVSAAVACDRSYFSCTSATP